MSKKHDILKAQRREECVTMIALLEERFPACFAVLERRRRPLKIGIHVDILAAAGVVPAELGWALRRYTQSDGYLAKFKAGAVRIDLDGNAVGAVTEDEVKSAAAILAERKARAKARCEARKRAAAAPPPQTRVRLSLDKLREAARQRAGTPGAA